MVGMGELESLTTSHPRAALDNMDLRINGSQSLTSSLFPEEMPALGQSVLLWKMMLILTSNYRDDIRSSVLEQDVCYAVVMSLHRVGKGWGKTLVQQGLERKRRDVANIQQKNSDAQIPSRARRTPL